MRTRGFCKLPDERDWLWGKEATVFPVVMYRCESWTIKKAEQQRIDGFKLRCWRRLLRVTWIARRPNESILKEIHSVAILTPDWKD